MVLKELICKFLCWECVVVVKELILTISTLGGYDALERSLILTSLYFGRVRWS